MIAKATDGSLSRRDFMGRVTALAAIGVKAPLPLLGTSDSADAPGALLSGGQAAAPHLETALDIAEWSYFWVGVERADLARGTLVNGKQMYVEYWIPAQVRHPIPIVLVHGGGGQGLDWMGTPDGRPGWSTLLLQAGYKIYVVDRPGHGRSPFHPDLHGPFPPMITLEAISSRFTPQSALVANPLPYAHLHNQWPGTGAIGTRELDQLVASQGGSYVTGGVEIAHQVWRERGAMLLDKIGPAIIMTHSAGGPFGWLVAEARPNLVKGIVCIEGGGLPFTGQNRWGLSTIPVTYDPPVSDPSEIKTTRVTPSETGVAPYLLQEQPARKLKNLVGVPIAIVTAEGSFASPGNPGAVAFLKQAGCKAEELRLAAHGIHGNGHMMMVEKNNSDVLRPILDWIDKNVSASGAGATAGARAGRPGSTAAAGPDSTAMKLADQGYFWVGTEHKRAPYGTIVSGQMYVQYLVPAEVRHPYPVVLVHGGTGQMLHYMGSGDGMAGWAHYYVQEGYRVYLVDRPGQGRAPYHPDALGAIGPQPAYSAVLADFRRAATGPNRRWPGSGELGDPLIDQFMASQNAAPQDQAMAQSLWASRGAELLDKIGPSIVQTHSAGGPFGWLVADERPKLVKAIVCVEGAGTPFGGAARWGLTVVPLAFDPPASDPGDVATRDVTPPAGSPLQPYKLQAEPARTLKNLRGIPIVVVTAENSGRAQGTAAVAFLKQAGCDAEELQLKSRGILGNGHFMMMESNRRQVFDVIRGWVEQKVSANT
jgi:pimeloyl-ACP methyl ester carboxylesterase